MDRDIAYKGITFSITYESGSDYINIEACYVGGEDVYEVLSKEAIDAIETKIAEQEDDERTGG